MKKKLFFTVFVVLVVPLMISFCLQQLMLTGSASARVSSSSAKSGSSHTSDASIMLSDPQPLISVEPRISGMHANGSITLRIIDISNRAAISDWNQVKKNVDGVYIKATEGSTYTNPALDALAKGAKQTQIPIGFYHYFWPNSDSQKIIQQADYFYKAIKQYPYEFYPVLDTEETNGQNAKTIMANVKVFTDEFYKLSKQKIMLYCSPNYADHYLTDKSLTEYPLWIANYNVNDPTATMVWSTFDVWQYGVNIKIPGASGDIDGDIATNNIFLNINSVPKM